MRMAAPRGPFGRAWGAFRRRVMVAQEVADSRVPLWSAVILGRPIAGRMSVESNAGNMAGTSCTHAHTYGHADAHAHGHAIEASW